MIDLGPVIRYPEGVNLTRKMDVGRLAFPYPEFSWSQDGLTTLVNDSRRIFGYPYLAIHPLQYSDAGNYTLTAMNSFEGNPTRSRLEFYLDVLCMQ